MQGIDATPLLTDSTAKVRDEIFIEEDQLNDILQVGTPLRMRTLITEDARLTVYQGYDGIELFDLQEDPNEMHNRVDDKTLQAQMTERLMRTLMENNDLSPKPTAFA